MKDEGLSGVFADIPAEMVGPHVDDVQDYEHLWEVRRGSSLRNEAAISV